VLKQQKWWLHYRSWESDCRIGSISLIFNLKYQLNSKKYDLIIILELITFYYNGKRKCEVFELFSWIRKENNIKYNIWHCESYWSFFSKTGQ
jgi:hypothetical protein